MCYRRKTFRGATMMEFVISLMMGLILLLGAGILLVADQKAWNRTYSSAFGLAKQDARAAAATFYRVAMSSGSANYKLYTKLGPLYLESRGSPTLSKSVYGDAVEFRYNANSYAFFYTQKTSGNNQLKVDYGTVALDGTGALTRTGARKNTSAETSVLANYVQGASPAEWVFRHYTVNNMGQGCVGLRLALKDPVKGTVYTTITAVAMRNKRTF